MIQLYYLNSCPFCKKVIEYFNNNNINFEKKDVLDSSNFKELMKIGGVNQVPFIIDGDVKMYESNDIIEYARKKYVL